MIYLDGKALAALKHHNLRQKLQQLKKNAGLVPGLAVILANPHEASRIYVHRKQQACQNVGIKSFVYKYTQATQAQLQDKILQLNQDPQVHGILLQLPLPPQLNARQILDSIAPHKDVDALSTHSMGQLITHQAQTSRTSASQTKDLPSSSPHFVKACTPSGILALLQHHGIPLQSQTVCVVGRSVLVGLPTTLLLQAQGATVTICHSKTKKLTTHTRASDIVIVATGHKHLLGRDDFKKEAVVIDVGIHRQGDSITGDVNPENLETWLKAFSPVPGGVGPMTVAMLLENTHALATATI